MQWRLDPGQIEVVDDAVVDCLRRKTPEQRWAMAFALHRSVRAMLTARVREMYPDWTDDAVNGEVARRIQSRGDR